MAKKNRVLVGFRERRHPYLAEIDSCIVMHPIVGAKLLALGEMIAGLTIRDKIPQIEVAIGDEQCVLSIRVLEPPTDADKERMRAFGHEHAMSLCLQSKGPDTITPLAGEPEVDLLGQETARMQQAQEQPAAAKAMADKPGFMDDEAAPAVKNYSETKSEIKSKDEPPSNLPFA